MLVPYLLLIAFAMSLSFGLLLLTIFKGIEELMNIRHLSTETKAGILIDSVLLIFFGFAIFAGFVIELGI